MKTKNIGFFFNKEEFKKILYDKFCNDKATISFQNKFKFFKTKESKKRHLKELFDKYIKTENLVPVSIKFNHSKNIQVVDIEKKEIVFSDKIFTDYFIIFEIIYTLALYKNSLLKKDIKEKEFSCFFYDTFVNFFDRKDLHSTKVETFYKGHDRKKMTKLIKDSFDLNINSLEDIKDSFYEHKYIELDNEKIIEIYSSDSRMYSCIIY